MVVSNQRSDTKDEGDSRKGTPRTTSPPAFWGLAWNLERDHKQNAEERWTCETYGTDTIEPFNALDSGQGAEWVIPSSNRDVDVQLGALEVPQAIVLVVGCTLETLVQLLGNGIRNFDPRIGRINVGGGLSCGSTGDGGVEGCGNATPFNGINNGVVDDVIVRAGVVQGWVLGDELKVGEVVFIEFVLGDIENLSHVHEFADCEEATKRAVGSFVALEWADK